MSTIRIILALGNQFNLILHFVGYMEISHGFKKYHNKVCKLKNHCMAWENFDEYIEKLGFRGSFSAYCLHTKWRNFEKIVINRIFVDDIIVAANNHEKVSFYKQKFMEDRGALNYFLGMKIEYEIKEGMYSN